MLRGTAGESLQRLDEAGHGTKALRMEAWTSMALPIPSEPEQHQIATFLTRRTAELDAFGQQSVNAINLLKERRSAMITAAVTGQIDVRGAAKPEAA
jgi:type I restriction enzyme S subunit